MNKIIHGLIALFLSLACLCLWGMLNIISHTMLRVAAHPPGFTQLCVELRPLIFVLPALAVIYCVYVWLGKKSIQHSWMPFFAAAMGSLVLVGLPVIIAAWLPVIQFIEQNGLK
jgi:hypothetical protein